jgi:hypothetical protein
MTTHSASSPLRWRSLAHAGRRDRVLADPKLFRSLPGAERAEAQASGRTYVPREATVAQ